MRRACEGADVLYYLVHSLSESGFAAVDRRAALISAQAAREAGVSRIVYLGGMHPEGVELSEHLASRAEVGEIFLRSGVPTVVLQAAVILGSGSASFEMLRYLTERLPVMLTPSWVHHRVQPIAIRDVLHYLVRAVTLPPEVNRTFDIGGPDVLTYLEMMEGFAEVAELPRRTMLPVPVLTPRLSSHWVNLVTPVPRSTAVPLIDSLVHEVVAAEHDIDQFVAPPEGGLTGFHRAVSLALQRISNGQVETRWSGANATYAPPDPLPSDPAWAGGTVYTDVRERHRRVGRAGVGRRHRHRRRARLVLVPAGLVGPRGDGPPRRRRRAAPRPPGRRPLQVGDALDWWRVEECVDESRAPTTDRPRRGRAAAAPARRDEGPGSRLAGAARRPHRARLGLPAARDLPAARPGRPRLLVGDRAVPRARVRRAWSGASSPPPSASSAARPPTRRRGSWRACATAVPAGTPSAPARRSARG